MPACPVCRDEFEDDVTVCPTDDAALVDVDLLPPPPVTEAVVGLFHPLAAEAVLRFLTHRQVPFRIVEVDDTRLELWVPRATRDDLRAQLAMNWSGFLRALEPEQQVEVASAGGVQPGWFDAPQGAWVDDEGRLRVDLSPDEEAAADAARTFGPALTVIGVITLLLAWVTGWDAGTVTLGVGALVLGLLLPR